MSFWFARIAVFANLLTYVLIRWPHGNRMQTVTVIERRTGPLEVLLLTGATVGTTLFPVIWIISGFPSAADYALHPAVFTVGVVIAVIGNWAFYRSHADLGLNWFATLNMREGHQIVSTGIYRRIRHPMYLAMFLQGIGQALILPNWLVGPAWLVSFGLLYLFRVRQEEQMLVDRFGADYESYMQQTGRLLPRFKQPTTPFETPPSPPVVR